MNNRASPAAGDSPQDSNQQQQQQTGQPPQSPNSNPATSEQDVLQEDTVEMAEGQDPDFPVAELARLDEMINRPRWVVPVLPKGELEVLLDAAIKLCKEGETSSHICILNMYNYK